MITTDNSTITQFVLNVEGLGSVLDRLTELGYTLVGPRVVDSSIVYDRIESLEDLPQYWQDRQRPGEYRVEKTGDPSYFNYTVGPHSWKKFLHPANLRLWQAERSGSSFKVTADNPTPTPYAFIGARACEIRAMEIQDRVFRNGSFTNTHYDQARSKAFVMAVNCGRPNTTCFCTSMAAGPKAEGGFDLCVTEFFEDGNHRFLIEVGSTRGEEAMEGVPGENPNADQLSTCQTIYNKSATAISKRMKTDNIRDLLMNNPDHPRWEDVANRCLSCANCTLVCPTCFCTTVEDTTDLTGDHAERWQRWDSCFTMDFSYVAGGHIRGSTKSRYRQWMTHKLASWHDQFGTTGCVGCGRCITWCPVGIDITEEVAAIQSSPLTK